MFEDPPVSTPNSPIFVDWPHAPPHRLAEAGVYFVTARAADGRHLLDSDSLKDFFTETLLQLAAQYGWTPEAWCVLSNHYHLVAHAPSGVATSLGKFLRHLHSNATKERNRLDGTPGRTRLWHNFRETHLDQPKSYFSRLHYVHANAVHHRLVAEAAQWQWSSAAAFESAVGRARVNTIYSFKYDLVAQADGE